MTGIATDAAELQHAIGRSGRFALRLPAGEVSITAVDGDVAKVRDLEGRPLADRFDVTATDGSLELTVRNRLGITLAIGDFSIGGGSAELAVELPRGTRVAIDTASADVSVTGISGPGRYRTASGDLILQDVAGNLEIEGVSADVRIEATAPIELSGRTISGDVVVRAPRLTRFEYTTTSGDLRVDAELSGKGPYSVKSISGDVMLVGRAGLQVEAQTVTGDLMTDLQHRTESSSGRRILIVGKPVATLVFKSVSGDLRVDEPRDAVRPSSPVASEAPMSMNPSSPGTSAANASMPAFAGESRAAAAAPSSPAADAARLEILKALERGEIDVETATERLMTVEGV
ncbi:MAG: DUF4097 family beta strand repeat protein [Chloroflexi bacterium]|nr:DUF4097 family beta strand repeat protein [Chloroflexota bacterium]